MASYLRFLNHHLRRNRPTIGTNDNFDKGIVYQNFNFNRGFPQKSLQRNFPRSEQRWTHLENEHLYGGMHDIIHFKNRFNTIDEDGRVFTFNHSHPESLECIFTPTSQSDLVSNEVEGEVDWQPVDNLGNVALFLGDNHSISVKCKVTSFEVVVDAMEVGWRRKETKCLKSSFIK
ncbi:Uncharacterized protein Fot_12030 [Forsythia ovata]|uniref:Uncharacterized protein n=1 Tax=Forsythia ovata TaxID=205694 RepID=A0ABD1WLD2_9LAMI